MIDLEYYHVAAITKLMDMGTDCQQLLTSERKMTRHYVPP